MTIKIEITGLEELQKELDDLGRKAEALNGEHKIPINELFTTSFMQQHTNFISIDALIEAGNFKVEPTDDLETIPGWDEHIAKSTRFANWQEMMEQASAEWAKKQLGL